MGSVPSLASPVSWIPKYSLGFSMSGARYATLGSSAFSTSVVSAGSSCIARSSIDVMYAGSMYRSSWSRKTFVKTSARGLPIWPTMPGNDPSSTSNRPIARSSAGRWPNRPELATIVVASPDSWLEPSRLSIGCSPAARMTPASSLHVVPLPLEPVTRTAPCGISEARLASMPGSMASATAPGTALPFPFPRRRLPSRTTLPIDTAKARRAEATECIWACLIAVNDCNSPENDPRPAMPN